MRILMILIPDRAAANRPVLRIERIAEPYYLFRDAGAEVVLASPGGGFPWLGLASDDPDEAPPSLVRFRGDGEAREALTDTLGLDQIFAGDFDAALCIGSPGKIWDGTPAGGLLAAFLTAAKPVAVIPSDLDLAPHGTGSGLLITGDSAQTPALAAQALLGTLKGSGEQP